MPANFTEKERKKIKEKLLEKGYLLLTQKGMKDMKISQLAKAAGIGTGTFYHFFPGKLEFVLELIAHRKRRSMERFEALAAAHPEGIPFQGLKEFLLQNLKEDNIYRSLTQEDHNQLIAKAATMASPTSPDSSGERPHPSQETMEDSQAKERAYGAYMLSKLATHKTMEAFQLFSQYYKIIVIGTSDLSKLNPELLDQVLDHAVDSACKLLY